MSFLTYDTADDIITSLEIIEKLLFQRLIFGTTTTLNLNKTFIWVHALNYKIPQGHLPLIDSFIVLKAISIA